LQTHRTCSTFVIWLAGGSPFGIADADCGANPTAASESNPARANFGVSLHLLEAEKFKSAAEVAGYQTFVQMNKR
jgi:hypothetical protein